MKWAIYLATLLQIAEVRMLFTYAISSAGAQERVTLSMSILSSPAAEPLYGKSTRKSVYVRVI